MTRPTIGITIDYNAAQTCYESPYTYARAVELAGGLPVLLPYRTDLSLIGQYLDLVNGVLLSGGNDLNPKSWGEEYHPKTVPVDPLREKFEMALIAEIERRRTPVLGVCLGSQVMNVYRGGSLHQFLPDLPREGALEHRKVNDVVLRHDVTVEPDTLLGRTLGKRQVSVNTYHKQSVNRLGRGLRVIATAPDGVVEGFEDASFPLFAAVQWHPERIVDEPEHLSLFKLLVDRSRRD